jgi:MoaA/NifB/PqqE/SkfB family radical SAM enzyme
VPKNTEIERVKQDILTGSARLKDRAKDIMDRVTYTTLHMAHNKAYIHALAQRPDDPNEQLLREFQDRFRDYRRRWKEQPKGCISRRLAGPELLEDGNIPLCIDIETAALCDLACGFCYREALATPDKLISEELFRDIIDQAAELGVPSVKLNWRGEPLLHPKLYAMVDYAKRKGILETIINTNATHLDEKTSRRLIDAGLDFMIYSFDGGTKETYERMRPGRFKRNTFEDVYGNISRFSEIRNQMGAKFPRTKIQMILTADSYTEQQSFYNLFDPYVDEITVTQYSERGGNVQDLSESDRAAYLALCRKAGLPEGAPYLRDADGTLSVAEKRLPCEQPYQRMMITYDGRVAMCCFDWGAMHPIGYTDDSCFADEDADKRVILEAIAQGRPGTELMQKVIMPPKFNSPPKLVQPLRDIWVGAEVAQVRRAHNRGAVDEVEICRKCPFKDTYSWIHPE